MIKITEFSIRNFKNIREANLELSNFNAIVGPNNSGKSNFLQVLSFINFIVNSGSPDQVKRILTSNLFMTPFDRVIPLLFLEKISEFQLEFSIKFENTSLDMSYEYSIQISSFINDQSRALSQITKEKFIFKNIHKPGKASTIFERNLDKIKLNEHYKKLINVSKVSSHSSIFRLLKIISAPKNEYSEAIDSLDSILKAPVFYFSNTELRKKTDRLDFFRGRTVGLDLDKSIATLNAQKKELLTRVLNDCLNITKIETHLIHEVNIIHHYVTHSGSFKSLTDLSDGSLLLIALVVKILSSEESIFLIEEPENSLHPKALLGLMNFIRSFENEKQFIIATHSIALTNTISPENVIVAQTFDDGLSELKNISNIKQLKKQLKKGYLDFSDYLFFDANNEEETETIY